MEMITELMLPDTIGGCRITGILYKKDAVITCLGEQSTIGRPVLLEVLDTTTPEGKNFQQDFLTNARSSVKNRHSHIISALNAGKAGDLVYCVYPYFSGRTLADILDTGKIYSPETALSLVRAIGEGMLFMWKKQRAFHGMLNPENILLTDEGDTILANFWNTVQIKNLFTSSCGRNIFYLSPEHAAGSNLSFQCDIYALGAILFRMTTGIVPFKDIALERLKGTILLNRFFIPQEEISRQTTLPAEFLHLIRRMCVRNQQDSITSWEEYLAESEKTSQNLLTNKGRRPSVSREKVPGIRLNAASEISPGEKDSNSTENEGKKVFAAKSSKYLFFIAIFIIFGGLYAAYSHVFEKEKPRKTSLHPAVKVPVKVKKTVSENKVPSQPPPEKKVSSTPGVPEQKIESSAVKTEIQKSPEKKRVQLIQDPAYRRFLNERSKLFVILRKAGIQFSPGKNSYSLRKMPHAWLMQNRETVYQHLDKMDTLLKDFEEKYPERKVYGYQKRYLDNIRRKLDECYTAYDEERQKENLESKAKQTETAGVNKKPEKVLPAAEEKNDAEDPEGEQALAEYRKKYDKLFTASCKDFMNSFFTSDLNITEKERMEKYKAAFPPIPRTAEKRAAEKIRKKYDALFTTLAKAEYLANSFYSLLGSSGEKYRNTVLSLERKKSIIWRIKNSKVTIRQENSPAAQIYSLPELGRYNLALLAVHVSEKDKNMQKYCFAFLLKIHAYKQAEEYARSGEEKQLLALLTGNFPTWAENKNSLLLLQQELKHLPPDLVTAELRKQIEEIETDLPSRTRKKRNIPIPRRANYVPPRMPAAQEQMSFRSGEDSEKNDIFRKRPFRRREEDRNRARTAKKQKYTFDRE
ncbi:MAG: protein kinase [Lentisphaeria bacterium]|nr:protein kinase [Lentisphaeria bacterium]